MTYLSNSVNHLISGQIGLNKINAVLDAEVLDNETNY